MFYYAVAVGLIVVLPIVSIIVELVAVPGADIWVLIGKWFVFWAIGVRLFTAGINQTLRPDFTARTILGITDPAAHKVVVELGFANIAVGLIGVLSLWLPGFLVPSAIAGGLFVGFAGIQHVRNSNRNTKENVALATDLIVAAAAALVVIKWLFWP